MGNHRKQLNHKTYISNRKFPLYPKSTNKLTNELYDNIFMVQHETVEFTASNLVKQLHKQRKRKQKLVLVCCQSYFLLITDLCTCSLAWL